MSGPTGRGEKSIHNTHLLSSKCLWLFGAISRHLERERKDELRIHYRSGVIHLSV